MKNYGWLLVAVAAFIVMQLIPPPQVLGADAWNVISIAALMTILWVSEAVDLGITALIPIVLFPIYGITSFKEVTLQYGNETIFLFMGGFMLALALEKSRIHERLALHCIKSIGGGPTRVILGFMLVVFFLSMWVSNTAAVLMLIPVCTAVVQKLTEQYGGAESRAVNNFAKVLYLSLAYAASIGGVCTLIGTPPNIVLASVLGQTAGIHISFVRWMLFATPMALLLLAFVWCYLSYVIMRKKDRALKIDVHHITSELNNMPPMTTHEKRVAVVFWCVVCLWIVRGLINIDFFARISDSTVAICAAIILFLLPSGGTKSERLLEWKDVSRLPWNVLLLFGGGLALSKGFATSGLSDAIAMTVNNMQHTNILTYILMITVITLVMTELMSNTATATLVIPISICIASGLQISPLIMAVPVAVSSSFAFMLPVSTPPNAIVFSSGYISVKEMALTGLVVNLVGIALTTVFSYFIAPYIL